MKRIKYSDLNLITTRNINEMKIISTVFVVTFFNTKHQTKREYCKGQGSPGSSQWSQEIIILFKFYFPCPYLVCFVVEH